MVMTWMIQRMMYSISLNSGFNRLSAREVVRANIHLAAVSDLQSLCKRLSDDRYIGLAASSLARQANQLATAVQDVHSRHFVYKSIDLIHKVPVDDRFIAVIL